MNAVLDTNILIDLLAGHSPARDLVRSTPGPSISVVTQIELLSGPSVTIKPVRGLLKHIRVVGIDELIIEAAAAIRRKDRLKLPDAVILATARVLEFPLITRNTKDFEGLEGVVIPYRL